MRYPSSSGGGGGGDDGATALGATVPGTAVVPPGNVQLTSMVWCPATADDDVDDDDDEASRNVAPTKTTARIMRRRLTRMTALSQRGARCMYKGTQAELVVEEGLGSVG